MTTAAHDRLRCAIALLLIVYGTLLAWPAIALRLDPFYLSPVVVFAVVAINTWRAREWARKACVVVGILLSVGHGLFATAAARKSLGDVGVSIWLLFNVVLGLLWAGVAVYSARLSTQVRFAAARGSHPTVDTAS